MTEAPAQSSRVLIGKTAIITGGASGIGLAIARAFATQGASAFIVDQKPLRLSIDYAPDLKVHCAEPPDAMF